jgi:hypothetical protein
MILNLNHAKYSINEVVIASDVPIRGKTGSTGIEKERYSAIPRFTDIWIKIASSFSFKTTLNQVYCTYFH